MIIRFRSNQGIHRIECNSDELFGEILEKWILQTNKENIDLDSITINGISGTNREAKCITNQSIKSLGLNHGDMLIIDYKENQATAKKLEESSHLTINKNIETNYVAPTGPLHVKELEIDIELDKLDGLIKRKRSSLCRHGDKGMCEYCSPLHPWDKEYQKERNTKHISFHAYVKELNHHTNKRSNGSSYIPPLSQPNFSISEKCPSGHEPWPAGICSKCQPSAITLQQQNFRMVDHVEFQQSSLIDEFLNSWRSTGMQTFGILYGTYQRFDNTPLGIKAVVESIWQPPQHNEEDGLTMDMNIVKEELKHVDILANQMGLLQVGMIFTDLTDAGKGDGTVYCKRHKDSFFLSSLEVIMSARHQLNHPNISKYSEQGYFSSKFVTCVISGNMKGEIDISAYQVSAYAEALVRADMITGCTHPSLAYINETTSQRYVPEIFYTKKNKYNITIKENAKPAFPVDYLLVSLTHGFPKDGTKPKFSTVTGFPWANRQLIGDSQDYHELKKYLYPVIISNNYDELQEKLSNFHLLLYINSLQILDHEEWLILVGLAVNGDQSMLLRLITSPGWQTLVIILQESM